jgi:hypothetical protein
MLNKIAKIQKEMGVLVRITEGYNYKYVELSQIQEKLNPLLEDNGLVLIQPLQTENGKTKLITIIRDIKDGEEITSSIYLPDNVKPQEMGSAITYYRRYSLLSLLNLTTEDDDGASASPVAFAGGKIYNKKSGEEIRNSRDDF